MDKETTDRLLKELIGLTRENNQILKDMNFDRKLSYFIWFIKWIVIVGLVYGAYQATLPYLQSILKTVDTVNSITNPTYNVGKGILEQFKNQIKNN